MIKNTKKYIDFVKPLIIKDLNNLNNLNVTAYTLIKKYNVSRSFIYKLAKDYNIKLLKFSDRRLINHNPFKDLDNFEVQYWLGFLTADGCISETKLSLGLQKKDKEILVKYCKFLGIPEKQIKTSIHHQKFKICTVGFRNKKVIEFLHNLGITKQKSFTIEYNHTINYDYLRGYIDGDGYISKDRREISFVSASDKLIKQIKNFLIKENIKHSVLQSKKNVKCIRISSQKENINNFIDKLYNNANVFLERKHYNAYCIRNNIV